MIILLFLFDIVIIGKTFGIILLHLISLKSWMKIDSYKFILHNNRPTTFLNHIFHRKKMKTFKFVYCALKCNYIHRYRLHNKIIVANILFLFSSFLYNST